MGRSESPTGNLALQKYLLLHEQHEELCIHLQRIRTHQPPSATASTRPSSTSSDSSLSPRRRSIPGEQSQNRNKACRNARASFDDPLDKNEEVSFAVSAEERRLFDVNESIKRALTELLNCNTVRGDSSMRMWAQARLLETEKELRSGRRRRSSPSMD